MSMASLDGTKALTRSPERVELSLTGVALLLSGLFVAVAIATRPLLPVDETRYLTVAWEMWNSGNYLVPHLNGETYAHKPPLLFWLINLAWALTGPSETIARLVPALSLPASVFLTSKLGRELGAPLKGAQSALVLSSLLFFAVFASLAMFDGLLTVCTLTGLIGLVRAGHGRSHGFLILGAALGLGILAKGPVIFVHLLPGALLAPVWAERRVGWAGWYLRVAAAVVLGAAIGLAWALPAAWAGGADFANDLLWRQSAGRVVDAFAHKKPFWFYLALLPALLCPFTFSRSAIKSLVSWPAEDERGWRLLTIGAVMSLIIFSVMSGKQVHYLLPAMPVAALLMQRKRNVPDDLRWFTWTLTGFLVAVAIAISCFDLLGPAAKHINPDGLLVIGGAVLMLALARRDLAVTAAFSAIIFIGVHLHGWRSAFGPYDLGWVGEELRAYREPDLAFVGGYHGELSFIGRLTKPVTSIKTADIDDWRQTHPAGIVIDVNSRYDRQYDRLPDVVRPYRGGRIVLWRPLQAEHTDAPAAP